MPDSAFGRDLVDAVEALAARIVIGKWNDDPQPYIGPLISNAATASAKARVRGLVARGAKPMRQFKTARLPQPRIRSTPRCST